jgi:hypothetical protein
MIGRPGALHPGEPAYPTADLDHRARLDAVSRRVRHAAHARGVRRSLAEDSEVTRHFDRAAIDRLTDPANYLGLAPPWSIA